MNPTDPGLAEPLLRGNNPLLPSSVLRVPVGQLARGASGDFEWARERLRVLSADSTAELEREYADMAKRQKDGLNDAQRYGQALAVMRGAAAVPRRPGRPWPACCRPARTTCGWHWAWARPNRVPDWARRPTPVSSSCCASTPTAGPWP